MMEVSIIGAGYVGLVTAACLAEKGHRVVCVDVNPERVDAINRGVAPIHEAGLDDLLRRHAGRGLRASTDLRRAVLDTQLTLIAVGTPFDGRRIDLSYVEQAARQIGAALRDKPARPRHVVVMKSTVVPGTTDDVVRPILEEASGRRAGADFGLGANPEFLTEGVAVRDFMQPDRIVIGGTDEATLCALEDLYAPFAGVPLIRTNNKTAEMIKYTSNALLATMISFSNEIGNLCAALGGVDVADVMRGVHSSHYLSLSPAPPGGQRITAPIAAPIAAFLEAGCGFGGSCLPKDVKALIAHGQQAGQDMPLLGAVMKVNEQQHRQVIALLKKHFPSLQGVRIAVLGLAFKPDTDDMRESPAVPIIRELLAMGARVSAYDPAANREARRIFGDQIRVVDRLGEVFANADANADAVVLVTRWEEFRQVPELLARAGLQPVFVDGRRMLDRREIPNYEGIGL